MKAIEFTSSNGSQLSINGNDIRVTNKFGDTYYGRFDENGKVVTKQRFGLGYILPVIEEYRMFNK